MSGLMNKVKSSLSHKDREDPYDGNTTHTSPTGAHVSDSNRESGYGNSSYGNQSNNSGYDNPRSTNAGPHSSNVVNRADPRVDSDLDGRNTHGTTGTSGTSGITGGTMVGKNHDNSQSGITGGTMVGKTHDNSRSTNAGPHNSGLANRADPRIDSDLDGSRRTGGTTGGNNYGTTGGATGGTNYENPRSTNAGPHSSNLANRADPRIDSDLDGSRRTGGTTGGNNYGTTGGTTGGNNYENPRSTNAGPHSSNLANRADPRVDSDLDGRGPTGHNENHTSPTSSNTAGGYGSNTTGATPGSGYHNQTTRKDVPTSGPHNSSLLNKLDPRVDSDRDGKAGIGQGSGTHGGIASTKDHSSHVTGTGVTEHDTKHSGPGQGTSNTEVTSGNGTGSDTLAHNTRHSGGGTYDSTASHRSGPNHHDKSETHHSGPGVHESSTTTRHNAAGTTSSTTHSSTHTSGGNTGNY